MAEGDIEEKLEEITKSDESNIRSSISNALQLSLEDIKTTLGEFKGKAISDDLRNEITDVLMAVANGSEGNTKEEYLKLAFEHNPNEISVLKSLANIYSQDKQKHSQAKEFLYKVLEIEPEYPSAINQLIEILSLEAKKEDKKQFGGNAGELYSEILKFEPKEDTEYKEQLAKWYLRNKEVDKAISTIEDIDHMRVHWTEKMVELFGTIPDEETTIIRRKIVSILVENAENEDGYYEKKILYELAFELDINRQNTDVMKGLSGLYIKKSEESSNEAMKYFDLDYFKNIIPKHIIMPDPKNFQVDNFMLSLKKKEEKPFYIDPDILIEYKEREEKQQIYDKHSSNARTFERKAKEVIDAY